jgi:L-asparaginase/Glu-tRNA(Gln) amidotransferase subunit D
MPTKVNFVKLGGTWDMQVTKEGLMGNGQLDDNKFADLEKSLNYNEKKLCIELYKTFQSTKPDKTSFKKHLPWVPEIDTLISGNFISLFSGDSSHYRTSLLSAVTSYLLQKATEEPGTQIIAGMGTDTVDLLLPILDAFLFDKSNVPPILISGANRSFREENSDAPQNFHDLAQATRLPLAPGAYYIFNRTIYKGADLLKVDPNEQPTSLEGLVTFFAPQRTQTKVGFLETGTLNRESRIKSEVISYSANEICEAFNSVVTVNLGDMGNIEDEVAKILDPKNKGVVIVAHALGNVPFPIRRATIEAAKKGKLIVNTSRCLTGSTSDRYYVSLSSANNRELANSESLIIDGGRLSGRSAKALLVRALLEDRGQKETNKLAKEYKARTF